MDSARDFDLLGELVPQVRVSACTLALLGFFQYIYMCVCVGMYICMGVCIYGAQVAGCEDRCLMTAVKHC